ncbi:hypothetical protein PIB30_021009 [Stylosanthes scabra]|uniref:Uncharacterized protein n=1 Tax=Stylosanthes scabra TaxID=79078 RepID=A0ABU6T921_9FABA|nr:hypothetical protein [Stylosanthes scabra]
MASSMNNSEKSFEDDGGNGFNGGGFLFNDDGGIRNGERRTAARKLPSSSSSPSKRTLEPNEDSKLKKLVAKFGAKSWNSIAQHITGRSAKSCRLRRFNQLDPKITKRGFSEEEEQKLLAAQKLYGNKWATISRLFSGRTDNSLNNHWHIMMARKQREHAIALRIRNKKPTLDNQTTQNVFTSNNHATATNGSGTSSYIEESSSTYANLTTMIASSSRSNIPMVLGNNSSHGSKMGLFGEKRVTFENFDEKQFFYGWNNINGSRSVEKHNLSDLNGTCVLTLRCPSLTFSELVIYREVVADVTNYKLHGIREEIQSQNAKVE